MKFSDNIIRENNDLVVIQFNNLQDYYNQNTTMLGDTINNHLGTIPAKLVKIGQSIYKKNGEYLSYRTA